MSTQNHTLTLDDFNGSNNIYIQDIPSKNLIFLDAHKNTESLELDTNRNLLVNGKKITKKELLEKYGQRKDFLQFASCYQQEIIGFPRPLINGQLNSTLGLFAYDNSVPNLIIPDDVNTPITLEVTSNFFLIYPPPPASKFFFMPGKTKAIFKFVSDGDHSRIELDRSTVSNAALKELMLEGAKTEDALATLIEKAKQEEAPESLYAIYRNGLVDYNHQPRVYKDLLDRQKEKYIEELHTNFIGVLAANPSMMEKFILETEQLNAIEKNLTLNIPDLTYIFSNDALLSIVEAWAQKRVLTENINFIKAYNKFMAESDPAQKQKLQDDIYNQFLAANAPEEINTASLPNFRAQYKTLSPDAIAEKLTSFARDIKMLVINALNGSDPDSQTAVKQLKEKAKTEFAGTRQEIRYHLMHMIAKDPEKHVNLTLRDSILAPHAHQKNLPALAIREASMMLGLGDGRRGAVKAHKVDNFNKTTFRKLLNKEKTPADKLAKLESIFNDIIENKEGLYTYINKGGKLFKKQNPLTGTQQAHIGVLKELYIEIVKANLDNNDVLTAVTKTDGLVDFQRTNIPTLFSKRFNRKTATRKAIEKLGITVFKEQDNMIQMEKISAPPLEANIIEDAREAINACKNATSINMDLAFRLVSTVNLVYFHYDHNDNFDHSIKEEFLKLYHAILANNDISQSIKDYVTKKAYYAGDYSFESIKEETPSASVVTTEIPAETSPTLPPSEENITPKKSVEESINETETMLNELLQEFDGTLMATPSRTSTPEEMEAEKAIEELHAYLENTSISEPRKKPIDPLDDLAKELEQFSMPPKQETIESCKAHLSEIKNEIARKFIEAKINNSITVYSHLPSHDAMQQLVTKLNTSGFTSYMDFRKFLNDVHDNTFTACFNINESEFNQSGLKAEAEAEAPAPTPKQNNPLMRELTRRPSTPIMRQP